MAKLRSPRGKQDKAKAACLRPFFRNSLFDGSYWKIFTYMIN